MKNIIYNIYQFFLFLFAAYLLIGFFICPWVGKSYMPAEDYTNYYADRHS